MLAGIMSVMLARAAGAQVIVSADMWVDEPDEDGNFWLYGSGMARSDAGWVVVTTTLADPSGGELDAAADLGTGVAFAEVAYQLNWDTFQAGEYTTEAQGEDEYQFEGCDTSSVQLGAGRFAYVFMFQHWYGSCDYIRCNPGAQCQEMDALLSKMKPPQSTCPTWIYMKLIWKSPNICFGFDIEPAPLCVADSYP
jgi:hypothetical protein